MITTQRSVWLGYTPTGDRFSVSLEEFKGGAAIVGHQALELSTLLSLGFLQSGTHPVVLDMDGYVAERISGYTASYIPNDIVYDVLRIEDSERTHAQLIASAYTSALGLTSVQESLLNSALQGLALQSDVASPSALADLIHDELASRTIQREELVTKLRSLHTLNRIGTPDMVRTILASGGIIKLKEIQPHEAAEALAALFIAKVLILSDHTDSKGAELLILTGAHRVFRRYPLLHRNRLLSSFLVAPYPKVLVSDLPSALDELVTRSCPVRVTSSDVWNASRDSMLLPNTLVFEDTRYGYEKRFIPRGYEVRKAEAKPVEEKDDDAGAGTIRNHELVKNILEMIESSEGATKPSVIAFLSADFPGMQVEQEIDRLQNQQYLRVESKQLRAGPPILALSLTPHGKALLEGMR